MQFVAWEPARKHTLAEKGVVYDYSLVVINQRSSFRVYVPGDADDECALDVQLHYAPHPFSPGCASPSPVQVLRGGALPKNLDYRIIARDGRIFTVEYRLFFLSTEAWDPLRPKLRGSRSESQTFVLSVGAPHGTSRLLSPPIEIVSKLSVADKRIAKWTGLKRTLSDDDDGTDDETVARSRPQKRLVGKCNAETDPRVLQQLVAISERMDQIAMTLAELAAAHSPSPARMDFIAPDWTGLVPE